MADDLPDSAKIRKDLLVGMYVDLRQHARHAETLRSTVVNFMIVIASLLIATITADGRVDSSDVALCLAVACVGLGWYPPGQAAAKLAARVLLGQKPQTLPIEEVAIKQLSLNHAVASKLGVNFPQMTRPQ